MPQPYKHPFYYSVGHIFGAAVAADVLDAKDPFDLAPAEIVKRMLAMGCTPSVDSMQREPFMQFGKTHKVECNGNRFLVAVSRDAETIGVQEIRMDPYDAE